jgi:hypothetical protein
LACTLTLSGISIDVWSEATTLTEHELRYKSRGLLRGASKDSLKDRLTRYRQIKVSVIGRKSGRTISNPVWFVLEGEKLYLLPVKGSDTQWYKNVLKEPKIRNGRNDVKKYYSTFDVAVSVELG